MADELENFIIERLREFDPSISTVQGSRARRVVVQPTVDRFGDDPFSVDIRTFILDRIRQEFPSLDVRRTSIDDLLVKPMATILEPLRREIQAISIQQSLEDPSLLLEDEADSLVANFLISRIQGSKARGVARLFFNAAIDFVALPSVTLTTADGLRFHPTQLQSITATDMQANVDGGFLFFDINVEAEEEGAEGEIEVGDLTRIEDAPGVVRVTNLIKFSGGGDRQTNQELKDFAEQSITERSLTTSRGVISQILDSFAVDNVQPIGFGDLEMDRDIVESLGPLLDSATAAATASISATVLTDSAQDFSAVGSDIRVGDIVTFFTGPNAGKSFVVTTGGTTTLTMAGPPAPADDAGSITYTVTQQTVGTLTISNIPGGVQGDVPFLTVPNNQVHIGNHTDAYVQTTSREEDSVDLLNLPSPDDATVEGDKDLLDTVHIDVDLISYVKFGGGAIFSAGGATLTSSDPLRRFGLVKNDKIRFISPQNFIDAGIMRVDSIVDSDPIVLTLVDSTGSPFIAPGTSAEYELISTDGAIQPTQMPLVRVTTVTLMNSDDPPQPIAGTNVSYRDPVDIRSTDFFSSGSVVSSGKFRVYFLEPTAVQFDAGDTASALGTVFKIDDGLGNTLYYRPDGAAILGDLGTSVRKVRNPDLGAPSLIDLSASSGKFTAIDTFELDADTFSGDVDPGDLLIIRDAASGLVTGNFYVTAGVSSGGTLIKVTPNFTGTIPTTGLGWEIIAQEDLTSHRISAQEMALNKEGDLFFVDIAAVSYDFNTTGAGPTDPPSGRTLPGDEVDDVFNLTDGTLATLEAGLRSLGYNFKQNTNPGSTRDETLAFSLREKVLISFTDRFMQSTVSDFTQSSITPGGEGATVTGVPAAFRPVGNLNNNTTGLESRNVRVNFLKAATIQSIQDFVNSGTGRVITENILIKHMIPTFVNAAIEYTGGLSETVVLPFIQDLIKDTDSNVNLSASGISFVIRERGEANDVTLPFELVGIVHNADRTISVDRSENDLFVGRISHFLSGEITLTRL